MRYTLMLLGAAALGMLTSASAQADHLAMVQNAASVTWAHGPANLPAGIEIAALSGDPTAAGPFTLRLKIPANTVIAPHTHSKLESVTVLSGTIYHETGRTFRREGGTKMGQDGFFSLPQDMAHTVWTQDQAAVIQVSGVGPFGVNYINPADDPSKK